MISCGGLSFSFVHSEISLLSLLNASETAVISAVPVLLTPLPPPFSLNYADLGHGKWLRSLLQHL